MWLSNDETKYNSRFKYIELARYVPHLDSVIRDRGVFVWDEVEAYQKKHDNIGIYTSVFQYETMDVNQCRRLGSLYFDLDSAGAEQSHKETTLLLEHVSKFVHESAIRLYFTGSKGFHIELEALALGISASAKLSDGFRYIASDIVAQLGLETVDFQCYDSRRMWRLVNSRHQKTNLFKVPLQLDQINNSLDWILNYAESPHEDKIPDQVFDPNANAWYRDYLYNKEVKETNPFDRIKFFEDRGTSLVVDGYSDLQFDESHLLANCKTVADLKKKAETKHHLEHIERLFLCSILTYNDQAEVFLYEILSQCSDFDPYRTKAHIEDWKRRRDLGTGGRPFTCETVRSYGISTCGQCDLEPKHKIEKVGDTYIKTDEYSSPSPIRFSYRRKGTIPKEKKDWFDFLKPTEGF